MTGPASIAVTGAPRRDDPRGQGSDDGFTLIEMLMALGLIAIVSAYALAFHVSTLSTGRTQANRQVAAQLVSQALDRAQRDGGAAVLANPPDVRTTAVNRVTFTERWTVAICRQSHAGGSCTTGAAAAGVADLCRSWCRSTGGKRTTP
jgi:prepilin-type N-terminal cleavage/methylation domain-containing protein